MVDFTIMRSHHISTKGPVWPMPRFSEPHVGVAGTLALNFIAKNLVGLRKD
jgi:hypothetical protein